MVNSEIGVMRSQWELIIISTSVFERGFTFSSQDVVGGAITIEISCLPFLFLSILSYPILQNVLKRSGLAERLLK